MLHDNSAAVSFVQFNESQVIADNVNCVAFSVISESRVYVYIFQQRLLNYHYHFLIHIYFFIFEFSFTSFL